MTYEKLYICAKKNKYDIVSCDFYRVYDNEELKLVSEVRQEDIIKQLIIGQRQGSLCNRLIRGNIARSNNIVFPVQNIGEDLILVLQYYYYSYQWGDLCEPLYYYNHNPESITSFGSRSKLSSQANEMTGMLEKMIQLLSEKGLLRKYSKEIVARKFFNKRWILPAIRNARDCSLWIKIHPDINLSLYANPYLSLQDKITSLLVELRVYPLLKKIIRKR